MTAGDYLRSLRLDAGLTLRDAASALGVTHVFLGQCERGRSTLPDRLYPGVSTLFSHFDAEHYRLLVRMARPVRIELHDKRPEVQRAVVALSRLAESNEMPDDLLAALERAVTQKGRPIQ